MRSNYGEKYILVLQQIKEHVKCVLLISIQTKCKYIEIFESNVILFCLM